MNKRHILYIAGVLTLWAAHDCSAALSLSVSPLSGGNNLRFGRISTGTTVNREVRIRITNTDGQQYQVYHRVIDPFVNESNTPLSSDALTTYTLIGSNSFGTLYAQSPERLGFSDQLLYSSGQAGDGDAFTAVYAIDGSRLSGSGNYLGRIQYLARPVGGPSQASVILNVNIEASGEFKFTIEGSASRDSVRLNLKDERSREGYVEIGFKENLGNTVTITQETEVYPQDELLNEMRAGAILFKATGGSAGKAQPQSLMPLERKQIEVYSSQKNEDTFRLNYTLDADAMDRQKAGTYQGRLRYIVHDGDREDVYLVRLEVEVAPVFAIEVDLPPQGLSFERLLPDSPPIVRQINVSVKSNLGRPYMVVQNVTSPLTNSEGTVMPEEQFTYKTELADRETGRLGSTEFGRVPKGDTPLFFSDALGSPSRFLVSYRLRPFPAMVPGDYTTAIRYSLGEL